MSYNKHNLSVQVYSTNEHGHPVLPSRCAWKVYNHLGDSKFENLLESAGDPCLILEDPELENWPVMSFLLPDEIEELAEKLYRAAEGGSEPLIGESDSGYEKHNIAVWKYKQDDPGRVSPPDHARWVVRKHQGGGKFNSSPDASGPICLILEDGANNFLPVMSFLDPDEANGLAKRLKKAAEGAWKRRSVDPDALLDTSQAAEILGVTPRQITRLIRGGQLEASRFNNVYILTRTEVERYQRNRKSPGRPAATALRDEMTIMFDDDSGESWKLPFSIARRVVPEEHRRFEEAVEKLTAAVVGMDLYAMESTCREFLARREMLVDALKGAVVRIPEYLEG